MFEVEEVTPEKGSNNTHRTIDDFKKLMKSASDSVSSLPLEELPTAFQISFSLIENVSGMMMEAFECLKSHQIQEKDLESVESTNGMLGYFTNKIRSENHESKENEPNIDFNSTKCNDSGNGKELSGTSKRETGINECGVSYPLTQVSSNLRRKFPSSSEVIDSINNEFLTKQAREDMDCETNVDILSTCESKAVINSNGCNRPMVYHDTFNGNCSRVVSDIRRWRLASTDRLNTLIDECEKQINGRKLYVCKFCGKVYEIKSSMRYHMKIIHLQMHLRTTEMQCRICGKQFTCVSAVNRHQAKCVLANYPDPNSFKPKPPLINSKEIRSNSFSEHDSRNNTSELTKNCSKFAIDSHLTNTYSNLVPASLLAGVNYPTLNTSAFGMYNAPERDENLNHADDCATTAFSKSNCVSGKDTVQKSGNDWPKFPNINSNLSDLTSFQLEMCMKAVVQGFQNKINNVGSNAYPNDSGQHVTLLDGIKSNVSGAVCLPDTHRNSFSSSHTPPSDVSEISQTTPSMEGEEVAMDLSSRSQTESVMIASF